MAMYGKLTEFDDDDDNWVEYIERYIANDIDEAGKKKAILLSSSGAKTFALFRNLLAPNSPAERTYTELIELMKTHKTPTPSIILERLKFFKRDRQENKNIATYRAELRKLSRFCDFRNNLEDMLRDRLACGVRNNRMQQKLLSEPTLTLAQSVSTWLN